MSKKRYFILEPITLSEDESRKLSEKAKMYYGEKDYEDVTNLQECLESIKQAIPDTQSKYNISLMLVGFSSIAMAQSDSVYVANGWENSEYCKLCHALAFSHGIDIVYESI